MTRDVRKMVAARQGNVTSGKHGCSGSDTTVTSSLFARWGADQESGSDAIGLPRVLGSQGGDGGEEGRDTVHGTGTLLSCRTASLEPERGYPADG
jgi:hypothetical protein